MVKHTQIVRQLLSTNFFSVFDHFVGLALKTLNISKKNSAFISMILDHFILSEKNVSRKTGRPIEVAILYKLFSAEFCG